MTKSRAALAAVLITLLALALIPTSHADSVIRPMLVRVHTHDPDLIAHLMTSFDETHNHSADEIELLLWPGDLARLEALDVSYEVITDDLFARDDMGETAAKTFLPLPGPDRKDYRRLGDYNREMKALAKKHPKLVKLFKMPRKSLEGRTIYGVEVAANVRKVRDGRPIFYMDGVHHAREWPAGEYTMLYIHHLVENFGKDRQVTSLLKRARLISVPIVNPDGFNFSRESVLSANQTLRDRTSLTGYAGFEGYWRKNRRSLTGETTPDTLASPDAYGVDNNRNYSYLWGDSHGGSSEIPVAQTYRGSRPFSEPESANVRDLILRRNVTAVVTNHTYQASVLRTGGGRAPEDTMLRLLGQKVANVLGYTNAPSVGYPTTGTTDDWAYAAMGAIGYTIEHGRLGFHPGYDKEVGAFWKEHMKAFDILFEAAANRRYHSVIKGRVAGKPAKLTLTKSFKTPLSPGNPTGKSAVPEKLRWSIRTRPNGTFAWHVTPSKRPYVKKAESYRLKVTSGGESKTLRVRVGRDKVENLRTIRL
ncbi:MAG: M14 family metallopeptidase [Actinomycetota bacterium]|nr:M14 family metallopeptidase [Actinomycetota bacterium]